MLRRLLERPCSLALLVGCQFAFVAYFSLGGFRNLTALFGRSAGPAVDYSRTHDVYANLSRLGSARAAPPDPARPLPFCPERSPFLGETAEGGTGRGLGKGEPRGEPGGIGGRERTGRTGRGRGKGEPRGEPGGVGGRESPGENREGSGEGRAPGRTGRGVPRPGTPRLTRAKLLNVGVKEALKDEDWDCLFLHDVDLIPENDHNLYTCDPWNPKHVSVAMNKFGYSVPCPLCPLRVRLAGMKISRPPISIGHYKMVKHKSDKGNEENPHRY
ncbi:B4GT3 galactosyltransferase, partial [Cinclus mexicanus]|nr:B4GT3 galactosyltransferase [Cinclus mexicanus]